MVTCYRICDRFNILLSYVLHPPFPEESYKCRKAGGVNYVKLPIVRTLDFFTKYKTHWRTIINCRALHICISSNDILLEDIFLSLHLPKNRVGIEDTSKLRPLCAPAREG